MANKKDIFLKAKNERYLINKKLKEKIMKALNKGDKLYISESSFTGHDTIKIKIRKRKDKICVDHISAGMKSENMAGFYQELNSWKELKELLFNIFNTPSIYV